MKKISIYVKDCVYNPSSYYRIVQYFKGNNDVIFHAQLRQIDYKKYMPISKKNILIKMFVYIKILFRVFFQLQTDLFNKPKCIIISRRLINIYMPLSYKKILLRLKKHNVKIIWDFDDHIIQRKEVSKKTFLFFCKITDKIVVTNLFLKNLIPKEYHYKIKILPTTDSTINKALSQNLIFQREKLFDKEIHLVWVGTRGNLKYVLNIIPTLDKVAEIIQNNNKKLFLNIVCDYPLEINTNCLQITNIKWTRAIASEIICKSHIGIMPLVDTEFNKGKGAFKLIQYLSAGLPVVGSAVGFNNEVISDEYGILVDDNINFSAWVQAIVSITKDKNEWLQKCQNAKLIWNEKFNYDTTLAFWEKEVAL